MKKNVLIFTALIAAMSMSASAFAAGTKAPATASAPTAKPKTCDKGWVAMGSISKIDAAKDGKVTETIQMKNGTTRVMPAFKPTRLYSNKVGDAYCEDTTPDNY